MVSMHDCWSVDWRIKSPKSLLFEFFVVQLVKLDEQKSCSYLRKTAKKTTYRRIRGRYEPSLHIFLHFRTSFVCYCGRTSRKSFNIDKTNKTNTRLYFRKFWKKKKLWEFLMYVTGGGENKEEKVNWKDFKKKLKRFQKNWICSRWILFPSFFLLPVGLKDVFRRWARFYSFWIP